jgi:hypothetical protein
MLPACRIESHDSPFFSLTNFINLKAPRNFSTDFSETQAARSQDENVFETEPVI